MESPFIQYEWEIEDLKKKNIELEKRITFLGDLVFKARDLANKVRLNYPTCAESTYLMAKEFLEESNEGY